MQDPYAIVVVDVWDTKNLANKNLVNIYEQMTQRICKLITCLPNKHQNRVLICNYNTEMYCLHPNLKSVIYDYSANRYLRYSLHTDDQSEAIAWLNDNNIKKLYYTGSSMPGCVSDRPMGMKNMPDSFEKSVVLDAISLITAFDHHSDWAVLHYMYQTSIELSKTYGWEITWTDQILNNRDKIKCV
jgi:hypothetical protein